MVRFVEQTLEVPFGIVMAIWVSHLPKVSTALRFVGSHTLPIYLGHPIGLTIGYGFFMAWFPHTVSLDGQTLLDNTRFWLIACFVFAALAALALWALGKVPIVGWLLKPPSITHLVETAPRRDHPENEASSSMGAGPTRPHRIQI